MLQTAPWHIHAPEVPGKPARIKIPQKRLYWGLAVLLVVLLVGGSLLIPPVRAIARQIIFSFITAPTNQIVITVTPARPGDLYNFTDPANFSLTFIETQYQAGFTLKQLNPLPEGMTLAGGRYDPSYNAASLLYLGDQYVLILTQRPLGNSQDVLSIGQGATIEIVYIGSIRGEFVEGGWKAISTQGGSNDPTSQDPINITAEWDNSLPQSTLRWQLGQTAYELRAVGEGSPSQLDLIKWANELK